MQDVDVPKGVWPTMLTPFTETNEIDYPALEHLVEWYIGQGVDGLFAVCQSSEMFYLTLEERVALARFVLEKANGRVPVIASGHISDELDDQIAELRAIAETGVQAVVMVSNRLAKQEESEEIWKAKAEKLLAALPDVSFGLYECPYPYKRLLSPELLGWCEGTGRFLFLKDTCCDSGEIRRKLAAVQGGKLGVYNANAATLLESLVQGVSGYSGVMANFHPELYVWLMDNWTLLPDRAEHLQSFLSFASVIECQQYPINAKYYLSLEGLPIGLHTRSKASSLLTYANKLEVESLFRLTTLYREQYRLSKEESAQ